MCEKKHDKLFPSSKEPGFYNLKTIQDIYMTQLNIFINK